MAGKLYATETRIGAKLEFDIDQIQEIVGHPASPEDYGFHKTAADDYTSLVGEFSENIQDQNDLMTTIELAINGDDDSIEEYYLVLQSPEEIQAAIAQGGGDLHMNDALRHRRLAALERALTEADDIHATVGFGDTQVVATPYTVKGFEDSDETIKLSGQSLLADLRKELSIESADLKEKQDTLYLTEALDGVKLAVLIEEISDMIPRQATAEDNGFLKVSSADGDRFGDILLGFGDRFHIVENEDATEILSSKGSFSVLQKRSEIVDAIENGISDLHMSKDVRARQAIVFSSASFEAKNFHVVKGFGWPEVFAHNPFTTPRPDIETIGPRSHAEIRADLTNSRLIDGSRPTDLLRSFERADQPSQKKLES